MIDDVVRHFTSTVYIVANQKLLLVEHKKIGSWIPPGGHVDPNEAPSETCVRESMEETGLEIDLIVDDEHIAADKYLLEFDERAVIIPSPWKVLLEKVSATHYHIDFLYLATAKHTNLQTKESQALKWFSIKELEENPSIFPNVKYFGAKAINFLK